MIELGKGGKREVEDIKKLERRVKSLDKEIAKKNLKGQKDSESEQI